VPGAAGSLISLRGDGPAGFTASAGGYRVQGTAGPAGKPVQVSVEIAAPASLNGVTRWLSVTGVMAWSQGSWRLFSADARELAKQPSGPGARASRMSPGDRRRVFSGSESGPGGWVMYANDAPGAPAKVVRAPGAAPYATAGTVAADDAAGDLGAVPGPVTAQTLDAAVAAFTSLVTWLNASPAARANPQLGVDQAGGGLLDAASARMLVTTQRDETDDFTPSAGGYRVLAYSGPPGQPGQVAVEVVGPATFGDASRWLVFGGLMIVSTGAIGAGAAPKTGRVPVVIARRVRV
jgi:hypothetical protein